MEKNPFSIISFYPQIDFAKFRNFINFQLPEKAGKDHYNIHRQIFPR